MPHQERRTDRDQRTVLPELLPCPDSTKRLYLDLMHKKVFIHPIYPLTRCVGWHEGWKMDPPRESRNAPGVRKHAYDLALGALNSPERISLADRVLERRRSWIKKFEAVGCAQRLTLRALTEVVVNLVNRSPLELGLALHHLYGFPILPGSALKGIALQAHGVGASQLYGTQESAGSIVILDGLPITCKVQRDVMTPHSPKWYRGEKGALPDDADSPNPIPFLSVAAGSEFEVVLIAREPATAQEDLNAVVSDLKRGLDEFGLGAKTAAGYGVFEILNTVEQEPSAAASEQPIDRPGIPLPSRKPSESEHDIKIGSLRALGKNPAGQIDVFVNWCLGLTDPSQKQEAAAAIVGKMEKKWLKDKAKTSEKWRIILDLTRGEAGEK